MLQRQSRRIGACFTAASVLETCVWPSPGLVSPRDSGAHDDMNYLTFMVGSSVLASYFSLFAEIGRERQDHPADGMLDALREVGAEAEEDLLTATSGVNTQRGQLFLLGVASGVTGLCMARDQAVPSYEYYATVREVCRGLCDRELAALGPGQARTTGERLYFQIGTLGVRGEAEAGFPTVERLGYPAFAAGLREGLSVNDAGVHSLISIMSALEDTTVLGRLGREGLGVMHAAAKDILDAGSVFTEVGRIMICEAHRRFTAMRLSPGGAADLLALSMALRFVQLGLPDRESMLAPSLFRGLA